MKFNLDFKESSDTFDLKYNEVVEVGGTGGGITKETDPTVPEWAKQPQKPTYTAEEVGAQPKGDYALKSEIPEIPTIPEKLPNPYALTFKGAVNATYDGSEAVEVEIPQGGGGGSAEWNISTVTTTEEVASVRIDTPTTYEEIRFFIKLPAALKVNINVDVHGSSKYVNYNKKPLYNTANLTYAIYAWYTPEDKNGQTRFDAVYFAGGNAGVYPLGGAYWAVDPTPKITFAPHDSGAVFAVGSKFAVMWR